MLAMGQVRYVGDAVAAVIATSRAAAQDAAEAIIVDYEPLPAVTDVAEAIKPEAPQIWPDLAQENESVLFRLGDRAAVDAAFARAAHITRFDFRITRVSANPMEPRNALASYDPVEERYTLTTGTQLPHVMRNEIAEFALKIPTNRLRIISPDVGGGFGMKESPFQEHVLALHGAKRLGRPVRWTATRTESFLADTHARDNVSTAELALAADGIFLDLRSNHFDNQYPELRWHPSGLWTRFSETFRMGLLDVYEGFYLENDDLYYVGLEKIGLLRPEFSPTDKKLLGDLFREQFGKALDEDMQFDLEHFKTSIIRMSDFMLKRKVHISKDFLPSS
jgi:hypothetical protein